MFFFSYSSNFLCYFFSLQKTTSYLVCNVIVQFTKAVSHLLQWLLNCLNFQQEEDEDERKRGKEEMQDEKRPEFNCNKNVVS